MRILSSPHTFFYKYVYMSLWLAGFGIAAKDVLTAGPADPRFVQYSTIWALFSLFIYFSTGSIKKVTLAENQIIVSNYLSEQRIPVAHLQAIGGSSFLSPKQVWFIVERGKETKKKICFIPAGKRVRGIGKHPMVRELSEELQLKVAA